MNNWWASLDTFDQTIWLITIPVTVIFVLQMIFTFLGMDSNNDLDADFDGDMSSEHGQAPFQLFTFRNFTNFLLGFGWTVICFKNVIPNQGILILLGVIVGCALVAAVMYIFISMTKLSQQGNMDINNALNQTAEVYLTIPAKKTGLGKVHIQIQGTLREIDAITLGDKIPTGSQVKILSVTKNNLLLVALA
ncbi:hypothetical protein [Pedobacter alpinus]|uniref:Serine protease n=1 Tax=Pedobacter alpinus TaxID=1590643 RepID=A0ABW5TN40_9SPHI